MSREFAQEFESRRPENRVISRRAFGRMSGLEDPLLAGTNRERAWAAGSAQAELERAAMFGGSRSRIRRAQRSEFSVAERTRIRPTVEHGVDRIDAIH
jgi:hypothetical protein